jgi:hypothetical protein
MKTKSQTKFTINNFAKPNKKKRKSEGKTKEKNATAKTNHFFKKKNITATQIKKRILVTTTTVSHKVQLKMKIIKKIKYGLHQGLRVMVSMGKRILIFNQIVGIS